MLKCFLTGKRRRTFANTDTDMWRWKDGPESGGEGRKTALVAFSTLGQDCIKNRPPEISCQLKPGGAKERGEDASTVWRTACVSAGTAYVGAYGTGSSHIWKRSINADRDIQDFRQHMLPS